MSAETAKGILIAATGVAAIAAWGGLWWFIGELASKFLNVDGETVGCLGMLLTPLLGLVIWAAFVVLGGGAV